MGTLLDKLEGYPNNLLTRLGESRLTEYTDALLPVADKAHRELHIDEVYAQFLSERDAAIKRVAQAAAETHLTPHERTLTSYLRR